MSKQQTTIKDLTKALDILDNILDNWVEINRQDLVEIYLLISKSITRTKKEKTHGKEELLQTTKKSSK